jgi:hypothetical protein
VHACMAAVTVHRWWLTCALAWQEKSELGRSGEIWDESNQSSSTSNKDELIRQFLEDKLIQHMRRVSFIPTF